jgi:hypothetical protein
MHLVQNVERAANTLTAGYLLVLLSVCASSAIQVGGFALKIIHGLLAPS